ncbi:MAG: alcohol dehydrogenase [Zetaproteobacteria bacterium CG12_big_fil_rev_8_21_14_0_65_54_13]|nr:MAG: alcohol dehydrogenase [Zetaproteobacteria bacterium CG12_big_fil_rev_8_21_14_0_65_54_13]PIX53738.1 MAG: alcohol dehydrogenase [Zetaproteobacteria bacterium CG_4_10_14_3_um_filter_54_28]PJA31167.1 MAG: alcohol dehydrogenase [Zetaproteobacteria bacterium CG_4_9_14_3_um_filter_54_145]
MLNSFAFAATPLIRFGAGTRRELAGLIAAFGNRLLLVTGGTSFDRSPRACMLLESLQQRFELKRLRVGGEPSPQLVDDAVAAFAAWQPQCVVAIGGGSTIDAAKAIAGLLPTGDSVMAYLEGVGQGKTYGGEATPFIALPTTAGTGGETSKNAVLSVIGENGFKKSFRHEKLVARAIILDPELSLGCPATISAACGMDALTQLLESYLSTDANPMTDALALSGLEYLRDALIPAVEQGDDLAARAGMLYASSISGLTLANAGLGSVHGLASPLGAFFPIPHGVVCGTLVAAAVRQNIELLSTGEPLHPALAKYAVAGRLMLNRQDLSDQDAITGLMSLLDAWTERLHMPQLSAFGITVADIPHIVAHASGGMKTNPVQLTAAQAAALLVSRL